MRFIGAILTISFSVACSSARVEPNDTTASIDLVQLDGVTLGWGGIFLDRSRRDLEATLGFQFPIELDTDVLVCGEYRSVVTMFGRRVNIQWSSQEPTATVESIVIHLTRAEQMTPVRQLVARLRSRLPKLVEPYPVQPDDYRAYLTPRSHQAHAVMVKSIHENFIYVSLEVCFD